RPPHDVSPRWGEAGIHGIHRPREWDVVVTTTAALAPGERAVFVSLPGGTLLPEAGAAAGLEPLAAAVEEELRPPYRAEAVGRTGGTSNVGARRIEVVELAAELPGDEIVLSSNGGELILRVDDMPDFSDVPELERLGRSRYADFVLHARRLRG